MPDLFLKIEITSIKLKLASIIISESIGNLNLGEPQKGKIVTNTYMIIAKAGQDIWTFLLNKLKVKKNNMGIHIIAIIKSFVVKVES